MSNNEPKLSWTSHPLKDYPLTSVLLLLFMIILAFGLWKIAVVMWEMPLFYYLGLAILFFSLISYFIPTRYAFYENRIEIHYWFIKVEKFYSDFGCFYADKKGVMLSTFKMHRRLDAFRGQSIRFSKSKSEKEEFFKLLKEKIGKKV
ncbi:MAG: hypothetical protein KAW88_03610 [Candidatus Cloacimonetes bacterium]|nr:hypothetical protein [Candidatus Cloacimonadota bacterium]